MRRAFLDRAQGAADAFAAGLGEAGEVPPAGSALGLMGGEASDEPPEAHAILSGAVPAPGDPGGAERLEDLYTETLYLEVRDGKGRIGPFAWFALP